MSKKNDNKDLQFNDAFIQLFKTSYEYLDKSTKAEIELLDNQYKFYRGLAIDKQEELESTPKLFKKKRLQLESEYKEHQDKADKYFNDYLVACQDLYNLHKGLLDNENKT